MLSHRTNLLLSDEEFEVLSQEALRQNASIGEVIRQAIRKTYAVSFPKEETDVFEAFRASVKKMGLKGVTAEQLYEDRKVGRK